MRKIIFSIIILSLLTLSSCTLFHQFDEEVTYTIPKGSHYSTHAFFKYVSVDTLNFSFRFDNSAIYDIGIEQSDINKLFGFAEGSANNIHTFSARFGWRYYNDTIEILAYAYIDGVRMSSLLGTVEIGEVYSGSITSTLDAYIFSFSGNTVVFDKSSQFYSTNKFLSYPYFGGNIAAPHEVRVWVTLYEDF